jgi:hypothetical protein
MAAPRQGLRTASLGLRLRHHGALAHAGGSPDRGRPVRFDVDLPARVCLGIGATCLVGTVVEPQTWGQRSLSTAATLATALHLLSGTALVMAGRRAVLTHRRSA